MASGDYTPPCAKDDGVTRRDFLHDVTLAGAALALSPATLAAAVETQVQTDADARYYPPTLTGLRGTHAGAFEAAHDALAQEGKAFSAGQMLDEHYDLVVVGAGISGLAAAYFYRQQHGQDARILLLDNHDDFGGHAKRNEFHQAGEMQLSWGGTVNIEFLKYSDVGSRLLRELGIDVERLLADFEFDWAASGTGLTTATWFDKATYGRDVLIGGFPLKDGSLEALGKAAPQMPISAEAREALIHFVNMDWDVLAGYSDEQRIAYARSTRYVDFLREHGGLPDEAVQIFSVDMMGEWGVRTEDLSVAEGLESDLPGAHILHIPESEYVSDEPEFRAMFPDGNASIARLLVRSLVPDAFPGMPSGSDSFDIVTADLNYGQLDRRDSPVRLRLNSTVLHVENSKSGDGQEGVSLTYAQGGGLNTVTARQSVLACYNRIIPHICPSLPDAQKEGLSQCIKRPMGTVNVVLKDGKAIQKSDFAAAYLPGSFLQGVYVVTGVNAGHYQTQWNAAEPCLLHFFFGVTAENPDGLDMVQQSQAGRLRLLAMTFDDFEQEVHRVLTGVWGQSGLDVDNDILAITVNRWPHGYARDLMDLEDPAWLATPGPYEVGRQPFGNIAIANSDSGADAYTHTAIDQAWRAVGDLPEP